MEISVVVPSYNRANLIGQTLDAILSQTLAADEIIVVDDGSWDETPSVLASFGSRIRTIRITNSGDLVARNIGLQTAQGRLVAFCDSDDLWTVDFLETMSQQWHMTPLLLACYSNFRLLQNDILSSHSKFDDAPEAFWSGLRSNGPDSGVFDQPVAERLLAFQPLFPSCMMVARAAFLRVGGWDEGVSRIIGCDFATALRVATHPPLGVVRRPLVAVRKHAGNFSGDIEKMNLGDANVLDYVLRTRPELAPLKGAIRESIALRRHAALDSAFSRRNFSDVRKIYKLLPADRRLAKHRIKRVISALPPPLCTFVATLVSR